MKIKNYLISLLFTVYFTSATASPLIVAHRAGTADYPENTVHAISMAIKNQADVIWLSIQLTRDGIPVLYRPSDLKSLTNSEGLISEHSLLEIKMLDAAHFLRPRPVFLPWARDEKFLRCKMSSPDSPKTTSSSTSNHPTRSRHHGKYIINADHQ